MKKLFCLYIAALLFINISMAQFNPPSVKIGNQTWMLKNLDVSTYRNGDLIPQVTSDAEWVALTTGAYCYYKNDSTKYAAIYGKLYNWYAVNDSRGLAPTGWHVPSDAEWAILSTLFGGELVSGGALKEIGTTHWKAPNEGSTNSSGFTGLPGGGRYEIQDGDFGSVGEAGHWWGSTEVSTSNAWCRSMNRTWGFLGRYNSNKKNGCSVRCIKD